MKTSALKILFVLWIGAISPCLAQEEQPIILNEPKDWRYEKINFPLDFAPNIDYKGFEELRFAPGMFDTSSPNYFTYLFIIVLKEQQKFKQDDLHDFLLKYYRGLCKEVAKSNQLDVDTEAINVDIRKQEASSKNKQIYHAQLIFFDSFNQGQKITLHLEIEVLIDQLNKQVKLLALVSPQSKSSKVWKELLSVRDLIDF